MYLNRILKLAFITSVVINMNSCIETNKNSMPNLSDTTIGNLILDTLGNIEKLQQINSLIIQSQGRRFELDQYVEPGVANPNPAGFSMTSYFDIANDRLRINADYQRQVMQTLNLIIDGRLGVITGHDSRFRASDTQPMSSDRWAATRREYSLLNPHIAFRHQLIHQLWQYLGEEELHGESFHVLVLDDDVAPIKLYINTQSGTIDKLTTMETDHLRRDVVIEVNYDDWSTVEGGIAFPNSLSLSFDGNVVHEETRTFIEINSSLSPYFSSWPENLTPTYDETLAKWGKSRHQVYQMMGAMGYPRAGQDLEIEAEELAPGVFHIRGSDHHSLVVKQSSRIVVVEAPLHELRSERVIAWIKSHFPNIPITHVISTHHHSDHAGGLRTYAATGAIIIAHQKAEAFYRDIFQRPSVLQPDTLTSTTLQPVLNTIDDGQPYRLDDHALPITVYPIANAHAVDMVMIFVENAGVLFIADIYSPYVGAPVGAGGRLLQSNIKEHGLNVKIIAGGHGGTIDYQSFNQLLDMETVNQNK